MTTRLSGDVEGVSDNVALVELSIEAAIGVGTGASRLLALLHTYLDDRKQLGNPGRSMSCGTAWRQSTTVA